MPDPGNKGDEDTPSCFALTEIAVPDATCDRGRWQEGGGTRPPTPQTRTDEDVQSRFRKRGESDGVPASEHGGAAL